jgi:hypothetical protein
VRNGTAEKLDGLDLVSFYTNGKRSLDSIHRNDY